MRHYLDYYITSTFTGISTSARRVTRFPRGFGRSARALIVVPAIRLVTSWDANGLPVISPMFGLPPEKWECEFPDYLAALGDPALRTRPPQPGRVSQGG
jgi:hypothetical protein